MYLDDLEVSGDLTPDWSYMFKSRLEAATRQSREEGKKAKQIRDKQIKQAIEYHKKRLAKISGLFKELKQLPSAPLWIQEQRDKLYNYVTEALPKIEPQLRSAEVTEAGLGLTLLERTVASLTSLNQFVRQYPNLPYLTYVVPPISDRFKIAPTTFPVSGVIGTELELSGCAGEYEPTSFVIYSQQELKNVLVKASPLYGKKDTILLCIKHRKVYK